MKRILVLISMLVMFTVSCGESSPKSKVEELMNNIKKADLTEIAEISKNVKPAEMEAIKDGFSKITYKINKEEVKGNAATVNITVKTPDISSFMPEYFEKILPEIFEEVKSGKTQEEITKNAELKKKSEDFFKEKFKSDKLKYIEKTLDVHLKKENGKWEFEKDKNNDFILTVTTFGLSSALEGLGK